MYVDIIDDLGVHRYSNFIEHLYNWWQLKFMGRHTVRPYKFFRICQHGDQIIFEKNRRPIFSKSNEGICSYCVTRCQENH